MAAAVRAQGADAGLQETEAATQVPSEYMCMYMDTVHTVYTCMYNR